jgi:nitroimidazol reductase NimA-like FMN-containing flavoprotein (pyridoxamine 5'-phosphate oxidase superfamily)
MDTVEPIEILSEPECMDLLRAAEVGRLAISIKGLPEIYPVNFVIDDGRVVFRTAEGTKLAGAVLGLGVAFEVDGYEPADGRAWSVMVKGAAVEIEKMEEVFAAAELPLFPWHNGPKHRFVRIEPSEITGRRFRVTR